MAVYTPIDELLARPDVRALRALRWFGWMTAEGIGDILELPPANEAPDRNTLGGALVRLVRSGQVERRPAPHGIRGAHFQYRITPLGRVGYQQRLQRGFA